MSRLLSRGLWVVLLLMALALTWAIWIVVDLAASLGMPRWVVVAFRVVTLITGAVWVAGICGDWRREEFHPHRGPRA